MDLIPCPVCGSLDLNFEAYDAFGLGWLPPIDIYCQNCGHSKGGFGSFKSAEAGWNEQGFKAVYWRPSRRSEPRWYINPLPQGLPKWAKVWYTKEDGEEGEPIPHMKLGKMKGECKYIKKEWEGPIMWAIEHAVEVAE